MSNNIDATLAVNLFGTPQERENRRQTRISGIVPDNIPAFASLPTSRTPQRNVMKQLNSS